MGCSENGASGTHPCIFNNGKLERQEDAGRSGEGESERTLWRKACEVDSIPSPQEWTEDRTVSKASLAALEVSLYSQGRSRSLRPASVQP